MSLSQFIFISGNSSMLAKVSLKGKNINRLASPSASPARLSHWIFWFHSESTDIIIIQIEV